MQSGGVCVCGVIRWMWTRWLDCWCSAGAWPRLEGENGSPPEGGGYPFETTNPGFHLNQILKFVFSFLSKSNNIFWLTLVVPNKVFHRPRNTRGSMLPPKASTSTKLLQPLLPWDENTQLSSAKNQWMLISCCRHQLHSFYSSSVFKGSLVSWATIKRKACFRFHSGPFLSKSSL